ncbi:Hypothetical predicted protein, partial [Paramuricea clavata]
NLSRESRLNTDHFENLQNNIYKFASKGNIILCGDFNARIGVVEDFVDNKFLEDDKYITPSLDQRYSKDHHARTNGFNVEDITEFSHHSCLSPTLQITYPQNSGDTFELTPHIKSFIWNESQKDALRECMSSNEFLAMMQFLILLGFVANINKM